MSHLPAPTGHPAQAPPAPAEAPAPSIPEPASAPPAPVEAPARPAPAGERGAMTLWLLGLSVCVLFLGGLSLDLWRAFDVRRDLATRVDAAAVAGATGLDTAAFRTSGAVVLDPAAAHDLAAAALRGGPSGARGRYQIRATPEAVTVQGERDVALSLLRVLLPAPPLTVRVTSTARPLRSP